MGLPAAFVPFWYERDATDHARKTRWGMVFSDARFPLIYDANRAGVLEDITDLTLSEVRNDLSPALESAGSSHEHIEFWAGHYTPAVEQIPAEGAEEKHDVVMVFEPPLPQLPGDSPGVHEVVDLDEGFLEWYRASRDDFGEQTEYGPEVIDQLFRRDLEVFVPEACGSSSGPSAGQGQGWRPSSHWPASAMSTAW